MCQIPVALLLLQLEFGVSTGDRPEDSEGCVKGIMDDQDCMRDVVT